MFSCKEESESKRQRPEEEGRQSDKVNTLTKAAVGEKMAEQTMEEERGIE